VRELVRTTLRLTEMGLSGAYAVHELLPRDGSPSVTCHAEELHQNEAVGKDIRADDLGVWDGILEEGTARGGKSWRVSAGPITHRGGRLSHSPPTWICHVSQLDVLIIQSRLTDMYYKNQPRASHSIPQPSYRFSPKTPPRWPV
jgi:hypothetical protein